MIFCYTPLLVRPFFYFPARVHWIKIRESEQCLRGFCCCCCFTNVCKWIADDVGITRVQGFHAPNDRTRVDPVICRAGWRLHAGLVCSWIMWLLWPQLLVAMLAVPIGRTRHHRRSRHHRRRLRHCRGRRCRCCDFAAVAAAGAAAAAAVADFWAAADDG